MELMSAVGDEVCEVCLHFLCAKLDRYCQKSSPYYGRPTLDPVHRTSMLSTPFLDHDAT